MGFLKNARHSMGIHSGEWVFDAPGACDQTRDCTGCEAVSTRVHHDISKWRYREPRAEHLCVQERGCGRCDLAETKQEHKFEFIHYDSIARERPAMLRTPPGYKKIRHACSAMQVCLHCDTHGGGDFVIHTWKGFEHDDTTGRLIDVCLVCGKIDKK
jgi:hypothetical protein